MGLIAELQRRNVIRMAGLYLVGAWLLVQVASTVLPMFDVPAWVSRAVVIGLVLGFLPAIMFAWVFELTPTGIKRDADVHPSESIAPQTAQRMNRMIIAVLALALGYFIFDKFLLAPGRETARVADAVKISKQALPDVSERSIAVMPFADMSRGPDDGLFADGLSEEIINSLSRVPDLRVAARSSSFAMRDSKDGILAVAANLNVAHVLEGSVRRSGEHLRITAQLIRASDGFNLWSENYDRGNQDIIAIQEDVAKSIAQALKTVTDPQALAAMQRVGTRSVPAYDAYLKGLALRNRASETGKYDYLPQALQSLDTATTLDPGFAEAYAPAIALAQSALEPTAFNAVATTQMPYATLLEQFRRRLDLANEHVKDPALGSYYQSMRAMVDLRFADAARLTQAYLKTYPKDADALRQLSTLAIFLHDPVLGRQAAERLYGLSDTPAAAGAAMTDMMNLPDLPRAVQMARAALKRNPDSADIAYQAQRVLLTGGEAQEAAALIPLLLASDLDPENKDLVRMRQACAEGRRQDAEQVFSKLVLDESDASRPWHALLLLGRDDEAARGLAKYDRPETLYALAAFLAYPKFDVSRFPHLRSAIEAQGIEVLPPRPEPYNCKPEAAK